MKNKIKKYSFGVSLSGAIVVLVQSVGRMMGFIANVDLISNIVMAVAGILVVFGVVSAPTEEELKNTKKENDSDKES